MLIFASLVPGCAPCLREAVCGFAGSAAVMAITGAANSAGNSASSGHGAAEGGQTPEVTTTKIIA